MCPIGQRSPNCIFGDSFSLSKIIFLLGARMNDEKKQLLSHWGGIDVNKAKISMEKIFALFSDRNSNNIRSKSELIR